MHPLPKHHQIFTDKNRFCLAFEQGLVQLLQQYEHTGVFILVLANASFDRQIYDYTHAAIKARYEQLRKVYCQALREGIQIADTEDDMLVFLKILAISLEKIQSTCLRKTAHWELQFNHIRAFKPARVSKLQFQGIKADFNQQGFHFNRDFLQKERFWQGKILHEPLSLYYNKFPFVPFHCLLVPWQEQQLPQFLSSYAHYYIWKLCQHLGKTLPEVNFGYNAYGAGASVNHLHFHLFLADHPLPVCDPAWRHNGGDQPYPLDCQVFTQAEPAWQAIQQWHQRQIPYNLLYQPDKIYCITRRHQSNMPLPAWSHSFGWYEICGGFTTFNHRDFEKLDAAQLNKALAALQIRE